MIDTEQKTKLWLLGALIKLTDMGRIPFGFTMSQEWHNELEKVDWWELDNDRLYWHKDHIFVDLIDSLLYELPAQYKAMIALDIIVFFNGTTRHKFVCGCYNTLVLGK
jgi:hypothetical protein